MLIARVALATGSVESGALVPAPDRGRVVVLALALAAAAAVMPLIATAGSSGVSLSGAGFAGALRPPGIPPYDLVLPDQDGHAVSLRSYRGQVVVLTFLYSTCQTTCPVTAQQIRGAWTN